MEPVLLGQVALGDGEEARQARLRGEQVVIGDVEAARPLGVRRAKADGEQAPPGVVEEAKIHGVAERGGARGEAHAAWPARSADREPPAGPWRASSRSPSARAMSAP